MAVFGAGGVTGDHLEAGHDLGLVLTASDRSLLTAILGGTTSVATVIVITGIAVALFFNPLWMAFEQDRTGVPATTGYTPQQVKTVTGSILADLIFGPPEFAVAIDGRPVLDAAERSHMVDVRNVLLPFAAVLGLAAIYLAASVATNWRSASVWRAIARGSRLLVVAGVVVGVALIFFFDAAFLVFHLVFFPQGNFSFDPRTQRLTQLFPDQFWTETSIGIAIVGITIATGLTLVAHHQGARPWPTTDASS
jgi:integral membrane protein (TIGR01906 family)